MQRLTFSSLSTDRPAGQMLVDFYPVPDKRREVMRFAVNDADGNHFDRVQQIITESNQYAAQKGGTDIQQAAAAHVHRLGPYQALCDEWCASRQ